MPRDNFSKPVRTALGSRVAYRCCYPGCNILTIGPDKEGLGIVNLGEASHIHAASPKGPRYLETMTAKERSGQENGIWLCRAHARLIDADEGGYSAPTILQWKLKAEAETYRQIQSLTKSAVPDPTTLICLHPELIFEGIWKSAANDTWTFAVKEMVYGSLQELKVFQCGKDGIRDYMIIESQGDGRLIHEYLWSQEADGIIISVKVAPSVIRRNPAHIGSAPAFGSDVLENGRWRMVSGEELALQKIRTLLNTPVGSMYMNGGYGTLFSLYYHNYQHDPILLNRLIKIELTRLVTTPINSEKPEAPPELNFINRINEVNINKTDGDRVMLNISLEWGDGSSYKGAFDIYVSNRPAKALRQIGAKETKKVKIPVVVAPRQQLRQLANTFSGDEMQVKVNADSIMKLFQETLPVIMDKAKQSLSSDIYPLFHTHRLYRFFDNNTIDYLTSYDLELHLYKHGLIRDMGVSFKLDGFKKAGVMAFDVYGDLAFHFEGYYYTIGPFQSKPWVRKLYDQMPDEKELQQITNDFIDHIVNQINYKIQAIHQN